MVALIGFCVFLNVYATQSLLPLFATLFQATKFHVSLTVSATTVAIALASPIVGLLAEKIGRRQVMVASVTLLTLPVLLAATSPSLNALIGWRFTQGLIMPGIISVTMAYVSEEWASGGAAAVMAAYVAGNVLGGAHRPVPVQPDCRPLVGLHGHMGIPTLWSTGCRKLLPPARSASQSKSIDGWFEGNGNSPSSAHHARHVPGRMRASVQPGRHVHLHHVLFPAAPPFNLTTTALGSLFGVYLVGVVVTPVCGRWDRTCRPSSC